MALQLTKQTCDVFEEWSPPTIIRSGQCLRQRHLLASCLHHSNPLRIYAHQWWVIRTLVVKIWTRHVQCHNKSVPFCSIKSCSLKEMNKYLACPWSSWRKGGRTKFRIIEHQCCGRLLFIIQVAWTGHRVSHINFIFCRDFAGAIPHGIWVATKATKAL